MQAAQYAPAGTRVIVLHELGVDAGGGERAPVPALEEEAAFVAEHLRLDDQDVGQCGGRDLHTRPAVD